MIIIAGLGNPGRKYQNTRHNMGFMVLDALLKDLTSVKRSVWRQNKKLNCLLAKLDSVVLAKPQTMMNASGFAVAKILRYYDKKILSDLWVAHDDLDLPLGKIKIKLGGGTAGHRGLVSIVEQLGKDDFVRIRVGIGHPGIGEKIRDKKKAAVERYVLSPFRKNEIASVGKSIKKAVKVINLALDEGLERAMNEYH